MNKFNDLLEGFLGVLSLVIFIVGFVIIVYKSQFLQNIFVTKIENGYKYDFEEECSTSILNLPFNLSDLEEITKRYDIFYSDYYDTCFLEMVLNEDIHNAYLEINSKNTRYFLVNLSNNERYEITSQEKLDAIVNKLKNFIPRKKSTTSSYKLTYEDGYEWAENKDINNFIDCDDKFGSSYNDAEDGCSEYVQENYYDGDIIFGDYECTEDCSGHRAGYEWAEDKEIYDENDCGGNSQSFIEGCLQYVEDNY